MNEKEIWKDVVGYEGYYKVSNLGRIRSVAREVCYIMYGKTVTRKQKVRILKPGIKDTGYYNVVLCKNGIGKTQKVHRLVAEAFIPNPENKPQIDHIDANRLNNRVENLRWCTQIENNQNTIYRERQEIGYKRRYKHIAQCDNNGNVLRIWAGIGKTARELGLSHCHIIDCCKGKRRTHGGFVWKFVY